MKRISVLSIALLALLMAGCKEKKAETVVEEAPLVKVYTASTGNVEQLVTFTGSILPYKENQISSSSPVRIDKIMVDVGDRVRQGQVLVTMDQTAYSQTKVQLAQLEADYERFKKVYEVNGISKQQLDSQLAQVEVQRAAIANLEQNTRLVSPISGVVTARNYDPGDIASTPVLTVMQIDRLKVMINVSEQYFPNVKIGMPVDITLDIYPDQKFEGKVSLIYPAIDAATRTFTVEITIPNSDSKLRPGMFSRVAVNFGDAERVLIPDIAVQKQAGTNEKYIFVLENGKAVRRTVEIGRQIGDVYEVLSGVEPNETVITAGFSRLTNGVEVKIVD